MQGWPKYQSLGGHLDRAHRKSQKKILTPTERQAHPTKTRFNTRTVAWGPLELNLNQNLNGKGVCEYDYNEAALEENNGAGRPNWALAAASSSEKDGRPSASFIDIVA